MPALMALSPCHHSPTKTKLEPVRLLKFTENNFCDKMNTMFTLFSHGILTRNIDYLLELPHCRTEYGKRFFSFIASEILMTYH